MLESTKYLFDLFLSKAKNIWRNAKKLKRLNQLEHRFKKLTSGLGKDYQNGFGAFAILRSTPPSDSLSLEGKATGKKQVLPLEEVQVLTRYCSFERPYWQAFMRHYSRLGVCQLQVCVQSALDEQQLIASSPPTGLRINIHRLDPDLPPDQAIQNLSVSTYADAAPYTLMVDGDEYFQPLRHDLSIRNCFKWFPNRDQLTIPWVMRPILDGADTSIGGFWGNNGKPVARSSRMTGVESDHRFGFRPSDLDQGVANMPIGMLGFVLVHYATRSFRDILLRQTHARFKDYKNSDSGQLSQLLSQGELPLRLRTIAYLMCQERFIPLPDSPSDVFDLEAEEEMLRDCLSEDDERLARDIFDEYQRLLSKKMWAWPLYPATNFNELAKMLPSMHDLKSFQYLKAE